MLIAAAQIINITLYTFCIELFRHLVHTCYTQSSSIMHQSLYAIKFYIAGSILINLVKGVIGLLSPANPVLIVHTTKHFHQRIDWKFNIATVGKIMITDWQSVEYL